MLDVGKVCLEGLAKRRLSLKAPEPGSFLASGSSMWSTFC